MNSPSNPLQIKKQGSSKKWSITPAQFESIYGIPRGTLANLRWQKKGPRYFKAGSRRVLYMVEDVEEWISRNPVLTTEE